ncbi:hypothetical protein KJY77_02910 [Canibacter sp. lx-72]|uniref:hypothetical protein n=1 Tax=Canibacter zhuwentaonis TaxID=2837491 RepID=UPI001BDCFE0C|nr:hypothetical protein [Canibacter zhuwentaonis]MBT1018091.1 hypothetical protein [Canibacter zhuwentaonis]MBT1035373.1 hypothetical protein [Canibacter zhuwentaonis]
MRCKLTLLTGLTVGYILGARAGEKRYAQIKSAANKVWQTKIVQGSVDQAQEFALDRTDDVRRLIGKKIDDMIAAPRTPKKARKTSRKS